MFKPWGIHAGGANRRAMGIGEHRNGSDLVKRDKMEKPGEALCLAWASLAAENQDTERRLAQKSLKKSLLAV